MIEPHGNTLYLNMRIVEIVTVKVPKNYKDQ